MKKVLSFFACLLLSFHGFSQSSYTAANFAASGDTFRLTTAQPGIFDFDIAGPNAVWNYATLTGTSQRRLIYRLPTQTGIPIILWPYIYNSANVNLSSTDGQTIAVLGFQQSNANDFYLKNTAYLRQKASSFTLTVGGFPFSINNTYTKPDTLYRFPFTYNSTSTSHAAYSINVPSLYYRNVVLERLDTVTGWGSLTTPYGTFANCLKHVSNVMEIDSVSAFGTPLLTNDTLYYREIQWFDPSKKYPLLNVRQNRIAGLYITQSIEYMDNAQLFPPAALFAYYPLAPNTGDTVNFQNLSTNAYNFKWKFSDPSSGALDSSTAINPTHIFNTAGIFPVRLVAFNGTLTDTVTLNVIVNPVNTTYTFTGNGNWTDAANWSNNAIPPAILSATNTILIDPPASGSCILNIAQRIAVGATLTVKAGKKFVVQGSLNIQQ